MTGSAGQGDHRSWEIRAAPEIRLLWFYGNTLVAVVDDLDPTRKAPATLSPLKRALIIATLEHALAEFKGGSR